MSYSNKSRGFKFLFSVIAMFTVSSAYASGGALGSDDFFASMVIVAILTTVLGFVYLFNFINKIFKDPDYREGIKNNFTNVYQNLIDRLRGDDREYLRFQHLNDPIAIGSLKTTNYA